ncbi:MAG: ThiF family adenylyltransferase, partial [Candidatus Helarchaeota archaeon]
MNSEKFDRQLRIWGRKGQTEIENTKILIVGAGGIGSEVVKNLVFLGFQNLIIVDMDKVEISNLNRQMFFDKSDQGKYKAETLVKKINKINPNGNYNYINDKIQNVDRDIFENSDYIISALDNLAARIWLNESCVELKKTFIDGGAEGFIGHVQVVIPGITPCLMCQNLWILRTEKFKCNYAINPRT